MFDSVKEDIIKEIRNYGTTTLLLDGGYVDWTKEWLRLNGVPCIEKSDKTSIVIKTFRPGSKVKIVDSKTRWLTVTSYIISGGELKYIYTQKEHFTPDQIVDVKD